MSNAEEPERRRQLGAFLRAARGRIKPVDAGFGTGLRRRGPGLRREEVAELIGISDIWYARCEAGRARFSLSALDRLAKVLRLNGPDRQQLFHLARPEIGLTTAASVGAEFATVGSSLSELRRLARRLSAYSSPAEIGEAVVRALDHLVVGNGVAYWERLNDDGSMTFDATCGAGADTLYGYVQPSGTISHVLPSLVSGQFTFESDLSESPSPELRARVEMLGTYSYFGMPVTLEQGHLDYTFGFAGLERHEPTSLERQVTELMAAMVELAIVRLSVS